MRFDVKIGECMTVGVHTLDVNDSVLEAAKLLKKKQVGCIIITEEDDAVGIITERDIVYKVIAAGKDPKKVKLKNAMSKPLKTIKAEHTVQDAALKMKEGNIKRLPVLDREGMLVGIITEGDLISVYPGIVDILLENPQMKNEEEPEE